MGDTFTRAMPWKVNSVESERMMFVSRLQSGERMTDLCAEYGISRKTGYKLKERFERNGPSGIFEVSRRPHRIPRRLSDEIRELLLTERKAHVTWGPRKLREVLSQRHPGVHLPAASTIGDLIKKEGLVKSRRRIARVTPYADKLTEAKQPNDVWCVDYKGQFRLGNQRYCYPLTVTDQFSRYILACEGFEKIDGGNARAVFETLFNKHGLPTFMRSDNGAPFASRGLHGLSRLSVWWMKLGITPERIEPGHPEQNGRHERMHRTLKAETTRPAKENLLQQQERFDEFVAQFNNERPHEALEQKKPQQFYSPSTRTIPTSPLSYPLHDDAVVVQSCGHAKLSKKRNGNVFLSTALAGERVGIRELVDGKLLVTFATLDLGFFDTANNQFEVAQQR